MKYRTNAIVKIEILIENVLPDFNQKDFKEMVLDGGIFLAGQYRIISFKKEELKKGDINEI